MKKSIKAFFVSLFLILTVSGSFAAEITNKPEIKTVDNYLAVFDFEVRTGDKDISRPLTDSVIHEFSQSDKYEVIDRSNMNKILGEQKFQMTGCVALECKVEAGQILGVGKIVNGSVGMVGKVYYLTLQLIDVKTGKVELSAGDECRCELKELLGSTGRLAKKLIGEQVEQPVATAPKPTPVAESKTKAEAEETAREKASAEAIAKAKAEEIERAKAAQIAIAIAKAEAIAKAKAEKIERAKVAQITKAIAKAEAIAKAKKHELKATTAAIDTAVDSTTATASDGRFEKLASGVVRDTQSGLDWYAGPDKNTGWNDAKGWVAGLRIDGGGWRMPTLEELKSLYQKGAGSRNMTPMLETSGWWVWSGETGSLASGGGFSSDAGWSLDFDKGRELLDKRNNVIYKRGFAVRSSRR